MQDNGSSVNKIPTNNIDAQEDINISEAKEKNGEQELKLKKMKKKRRLSEDSTIKVHIQENQNRKIREAKDKNVEQEDKSLKKMKKHRLSQDTTVTTHQCPLTAEASTFIRVPKDHILEGSKTSIILKPSNRKEERNNLKMVKKEDESVGKGQVMMVQKKITHYLSDSR
ncbi:glutamic acid-rich protein-like isoform X2 [Procambarus clarkii]